MTDSVKLGVPGSSTYSFAPRVVAAWMMAEQGAKVDAIEGARLAVDELVTPYLQARCGVELEFQATSDGVEMVLVHPEQGVSVRFSPIAQRILSVIGGGFGRLDDGRTGWKMKLRG